MGGKEERWVVNEFITALFHAMKQTFLYLFAFQAFSLRNKQNKNSQKSFQTKNAVFTWKNQRTKRSKVEILALNNKVKISLQRK